MPALLYARRSTNERDERQVQSIEDQLRLMRAKARHEGLTIVQELTESQSAKEPGTRPEFAHLLRLLDEGRADTLLCWHLNRLFRNSVDMSAIQWRLQRGVLRRIITPDRIYLPEDNVLLFYMEAGVSNQTVLDLSKSVKRGLASKIEKGWFPHRAPAGYLNEKWNDKGKKTILPDPERFEPIRQAWSWMLTGAYTVPEVRYRLNDQLHYRSPQTRRGGGDPMSHSTLYALFANPFYAGYFKHNGKLHRGAHQAMVTWSEFERVQGLIGREVPLLPGQSRAIPPGRRRSHATHPDLTYCGVLRCTGCNGLVTGHTIRKPSGRSYTYYFCQNAKRSCRKIGVREEVLDALVHQQLERFFFLPEFDAWAQEELGQEQALSQAIQEQATANMQDRLTAIARQLESLLTLKIKELVSDEEFSARRRVLLSEQERLHIERDELQGARQRAREAVTNAVDFMATARTRFQSGDSGQRRAVALALSSNWRFTSGKVFLEPHPLLEELRSSRLELEANMRLIKLADSSFQSNKKGPDMPINSVWSRRLNAIRLLALNNSWSFPQIQDPVGPDG